MSKSPSDGDDRETLIFTCAGAAYSGQVCNRVGVNLAREHVGNLFCTAAVGARIPDKLERATNAGKRVAIDGCDDHCSRRILEAAGLTVDLHIDATALGVAKKPDQPRMIADTHRIGEHITDALGGAG